MTSQSQKIPNLVFIVPYRDRLAHLTCFIQMMKHLITELDDTIHYEIVISEQGDDKIFNRGAMKNLGFLYIKHKYPNDYKNITFIFNDVDTMPGVKGVIPKYVLQPNSNVKHLYGFKFALGGVFSIKGHAFESVNGFPNYWGWGFEDNCMQKRLESKQYIIDRSDFYPYNDSKWLMFYHGNNRKLDNQVVNKYKSDTMNTNGINTITSNISNLSSTIIDKDINAYKISHTEWTIPEKMEHIQFEVRASPTKVYQPPISMGNILRAVKQR